MGFKIDGLDDLQKQLDKMQRAAKELDGTHNVSFDELFPSSFMRKYTQFSSFDELLANGGYIVNSQEDFEAIPDDEFDRHISGTTKFKSWNTMYTKAGELYAIKKLGL